MKSIFKLLLMLSVICLGFTSCRDDAELPNPGTPTNPQEATAGTYTGKWTVQNITTGADPVEYDGTMTLKAVQQYVTEMSLSCPDFFSGDAASIVPIVTNANIAKGGVGYQFSNPMGMMVYVDGKQAVGASKYSGTITNGGEISLFFQASFKEGRSTTAYSISFLGNKN